MHPVVKKPHIGESPIISAAYSSFTGSGKGCGKGHGRGCGAMVLLACRQNDYTQIPLPKLCRKDGDINGMFEFSAAAISPRCFLPPLNETGENILKPIFSPGLAWGRATGKVPILRVLNVNGGPCADTITGESCGAGCADRFTRAIALPPPGSSTARIDSTNKGRRALHSTAASRLRRLSSFSRRHCAALADRPATSPGAIDEGGF